MENGEVLIFGVYRFRHQIAEAVLSLRKKRINTTSISLVIPATIDRISKMEGESSQEIIDPKVSEVLGWIMNTRTFLVPGLPPLEMGGPFLEDIAEFSDGQNLPGLSAPLARLGFESQDIKKIELRLRSRYYLLGIHVPLNVSLDEITRTLERAGAVDTLKMWSENPSLSTYERELLIKTRSSTEDHQ